jgi:transcription elongation factor GreA
MKKMFHLTTKGVADLEAEIKALLAERGNIAERIKLAREFGDLSENAEYSSARQEQERSEARIAEIDHILKNVTIIENPKNKDIVELGNTVILKGGEKEMMFKIVGPVEANPLNGMISDESPIGKALIGKRLDDEVEIVTPAQTSTFKIASIS